MATSVTKALDITASNAEQYCTASKLDLNESGYAFKKYLNGSSDGYATLNEMAMTELYPTEHANPFKIDMRMRGSRGAGSMTVALEMDGKVLFNPSFSSTSMATETKTGVSKDSFSEIGRSTRSSVIRWNVHGSNMAMQRVETAGLTLYFYQYACSANTVGNGVESAAVSDAAPYQGDTVTFTATLKSGATWHGWYSDAACTQLVSTNQTYTTAAADLALYAKATKEVTGTGSFVKKNGAWFEAQAVYKKINGAWVLQTDDSYKTEIQNGNYKVI